MPKIDWNAVSPGVFDRNNLTVSPSQIDLALSCLRKWWFQRVRRLPQVFIEKHDWARKIGDLAHEVVERHFKGQERYPDNWSEGYSRADAGLVKALVDQAISGGTLRGYPGMKVEHPYVRQVLDDVAMIGVVDVFHPFGIDDHKTPKVSRHPWIPTEKELASDPKMLCYACEWLYARMEEGGEIPETITLRLNNLCKDGVIVAREAMVSIKTINDFWRESVIPVVESMLALKHSSFTALDWAKVHGPNVEGACEAYGGCTYASICERRETPVQYRTRVDRINARQAKTKLQRENAVSVFDEKPAAPAAATATPTAPLADAPPWHYADCRACAATPGWASNGDPCRACGLHQNRAGGPTPGDFIIDIEARTWTARPAEAAPETSTVPEKVAPAQPESTPPKAPAPDPAGQDTVVTEAPKKERKKRTVKAKFDGFVLAFNLVPVKSTFFNIVDLAEVFAKEATELYEDLVKEGKLDPKEVKSFWGMNSFDRRDRLAGFAEAVAAELTGNIVFVSTRTPDMVAYAEALRPFASDVWEGIN